MSGQLWLTKLSCYAEIMVASFLRFKLIRNGVQDFLVPLITDIFDVEAKLLL